MLLPANVQGWIARLPLHAFRRRFAAPAARSNGLHDRGRHATLLHLALQVISRTGDREWRALLEITEDGVVHGHGVVAKLNLPAGIIVADPTARFRRGTPSVENQGARSERYIMGAGYHWKIGAFAGEPQDASGPWAYTYFVNEARDGRKPNARYTVEYTKFGFFLALKTLCDIQKGDEILVRYNAT